MNSPVFQRARNSWQLAFGDVVTLLLTFFIVVIVMNKSDMSKLEVWVDERLNQSYQVLEQHTQERGIKLVTVTREPRGIMLSIASDMAFEKGSFQPGQLLIDELREISTLLPKTPLLNIESLADKEIIRRAASDGHQWLAEVSVQGHSDNDWVNPESTLRNNFFLSTLRAEAVMRVLQAESGINPELFSISGYGEWQPVASNKTESGKRLNRRVEVLLTASFQKII